MTETREPPTRRSKASGHLEREARKAREQARREAKVEVEKAAGEGWKKLGEGLRGCSGNSTGSQGEGEIEREEYEEARGKQRRKLNGG